MRASNNNRAATVLQVFQEAIVVWGMPSRVRGDHGTENTLVAAYVIHYRGPDRGSYMWGRSVDLFLLDPTVLKYFQERTQHKDRTTLG